MVVRENRIPPISIVCWGVKQRCSPEVLCLEVRSDGGPRASGTYAGSLLTRGSPDRCCRWLAVSMLTKCLLPLLNAVVCAAVLEGPATPVSRRHVLCRNSARDVGGSITPVTQNHNANQLAKLHALNRI